MLWHFRAARTQLTMHLRRHESQIRDKDTARLEYVQRVYFAATIHPDIEERAIPYRLCLVDASYPLLLAFYP
jgi:hypothetical protein